MFLCEHINDNVVELIFLKFIEMKNMKKIVYQIFFIKNICFQKSILNNKILQSI